MSRTVNLIHREKRTHLRGYWGGGWVVPQCGDAMGLWVLPWCWCVLEGGPRLPQPCLSRYSFLFCSGDPGSPHPLELRETSHTLLASLPTLGQLLLSLQTKLPSSTLFLNAGNPQGSVLGPPHVSHTADSAMHAYGFISSLLADDSQR